MMKDQEDEKENEDMEVDDKDREERLERVKRKQREFLTTSVCRRLLEGWKKLRSWRKVGERDWKRRK